MGRKHCGKRRNCSLRAISPFPTAFSEDLYCRHVKTRACLGKGWEKMLITSISPFPQCFLSWKKRVSTVGLHSFCHLQMLSLWTSLKFCHLEKNLRKLLLAIINDVIFSLVVSKKLSRYCCQTLTFNDISVASEDLTWNSDYLLNIKWESRYKKGRLPLKYFWHSYAPFLT